MEMNGKALRSGFLRFGIVGPIAAFQLFVAGGCATPPPGNDAQAATQATPIDTSAPPAVLANGARLLAVHGGEGAEQGAQPAEGGFESNAVHGGSGGNDWQYIFCGDIVGLTVRAGNYVDNIQLLCDDASGRFPGGQAGGTGGSYVLGEICPDGWVATGVYGRSKTYLDNLGLICRNLSNMSELRTAGPAGGTGGVAFWDDCFTAMSNQKLQGFAVRAGGWVDAISVYCNSL